MSAGLINFALQPAQAEQLLEVIGLEIARSERFALTIVPAARAACETHHLAPLRRLHSDLSDLLDGAA